MIVWKVSKVTNLWEVQIKIHTGHHLPCPDSKGKELETCLNERHQISFHKKKNIMEKKTNVGENEKRLICLNTRD